MQIYGSTQVHGPQGISAPHANRAAQPAQRPAAANQADSVEISPEAQAAQAAEQLSAKIAELPDIRQDRVNELRAKIASGSYETDDRINGALERLLDEIG